MKVNKQKKTVFQMILNTIKVSHNRVAYHFLITKANMGLTYVQTPSLSSIMTDIETILIIKASATRKIEEIK